MIAVHIKVIDISSSCLFITLCYIIVDYPYREELLTLVLADDCASGGEDLEDVEDTEELDELDDSFLVTLTLGVAPLWVCCCCCCRWRCMRFQHSLSLFR